MKSFIFAITLFTTAWASAQTNPQYKAQAGDWSTEAAFYAQTGNGFLRVGLNDIKVRKFTTDRRALRARLLATKTMKQRSLWAPKATWNAASKKEPLLSLPDLKTT